MKFDPLIEDKKGYTSAHLLTSRVGCLKKGCAEVPITNFLESQEVFKRCEGEGKALIEFRARRGQKC